jgi:hypothetical protein
MNKKIIFGVIIVLLLLLIGGVFWWKLTPDFPREETIQKRIPVNPADYQIKDTPGGKIIENKKEGLTVKVPDGWIVQKYEDGSVGLFSPDIEFNEYGGFLESVREKGACAAGFEILKYKKLDPEITTYAEYLRNLIKKAQENPIIEERSRSEVITVSNKLGLKTIHLKEGKEIYISVEIPVDHTIYSFDSGFIFSEKCLRGFNKIVESISIQ